MNVSIAIAVPLNHPLRPLDDTVRLVCRGSPSASDARARTPAPRDRPGLVAAFGDRLVDALAVRAHREPRRVPAGHPLFPAQRHHRGPAHRAVHDLVLKDVVGEPLVVPVTGGKVRPDVGVFAGPLLWKDFGIHGWESTSPQFRDGSSGYVATSASAPPERRSTARQSCSGCGSNTSADSAESTYHAPSSISAWSWPGPHPAYPAKTRNEAIPPATSCGGVSRSIRPTRVGSAEGSSARQPTGSSWPGTLAKPRALFGATGPPRNTTEGLLTRSVQGSSTRPTGTLVGRFKTTPRVPSSGSSSTTSTTVRLKLGSPSMGVATSSRPARTSSISPFWPMRGPAPTPRSGRSAVPPPGGVADRCGHRGRHVGVEHRRDDVVRPQFGR